MSWNISSAAPLSPALASVRTGPIHSGQPGGDFPGELRAGQAGAGHAASLDAAPPREARELLDAAQRAIRQLHEQGRELHFEIHDGDLRIEIRDLDGRVLDRIPPGRALDLLTQSGPVGRLP